MLLLNFLGAVDDQWKVSSKQQKQKCAVITSISKSEMS